MGALDWMADALRDAGITVVEYPGWKDRAAPGSFAPRGLIWHHDASGAGPSPSLPRLIAEQGNGSTPPPLAQAWVDTFGVWYLTSSNRCNHAGTGTGWGRIRAGMGNTDAIGIETDHTVGEQWPAAQLSSLRRGSRVLLDRLGASASDSLCGHKEYTARKVDPDGLDMNTERRIVAAIMEDCDMTVWTPAAKAGYDAVYGVLVDGSKYAGSELAKNLGYMLTELRAGQAALAAALAEGLEGEELAARLEAAAREAAASGAEQAIVSRVVPALREVLAEELGDDNQEQAEAISELVLVKLGQSLTG